MTVNDQALQTAADKIKTQYHHAKILLFGSWAKNTNRPDSEEYLEFLFQVINLQMKLLKKQGKGSQTKFLTLGMITDIQVPKCLNLKKP